VHVEVEVLRLHLFDTGIRHKLKSIVKVIRVKEVVMLCEGLKPKNPRFLLEISMHMLGTIEAWSTGRC